MYFDDEDQIEVRIQLVKYDKGDLTINKILDKVNKIDTDWKVCKLPAKDIKEYALRMA